MATSTSANPPSDTTPDGLPTRFPLCVQNAEFDLVQQRRHAAKVGGTDLPLSGIALSGGGIRSATFSLGVIQGLAKLGLLKHFDYLSTVSGGGYTGGFLGALFCRPAGSTGKPNATAVEDGLAAPQAPPDPVPGAIHRSVKWLRENGRYLTPGGSGDGFWAAATILRNLLVVHVVMSLLWMFLLLTLDRIGWYMGVIAPISFKIPFFGWEVYLSKWLLASLFSILASIMIFGWAYWLVPKGDFKGRSYLVWPLFGLLPLWVWTWATSHFGSYADWRDGLRLILVLMSWISAMACILVLAYNPKDASRQDKCRNDMTAFLRRGILISVFLAVFGVVDSLGWTLRSWLSGTSVAFHGLGAKLWGLLSFRDGFIVAFVSGLAVLLEKFQKILSKKKAGTLIGKSFPDALPLLAAFSGISLGLLGLSALSALSHVLTFGPMKAHLPILLVGGIFPWLLMGGLGLLTLVISRAFGFLNLSTLGPTYTSALTRSYVGASNPARRAGDVSPHLIADDDLHWADYRPWEAGGPLHLINTTLNETTGGKSQVTQKDRKGMNLAVGPVGLTVGVQHHALWDRARTGANGIPKKEGYSVFGVEGQPFRPESLSLGQWIGISGAAVSTGMGANTSLAYSLWLGFLNVRLGYWWGSGVEVKQGRGIPGSFRPLLEWLLPVHSRLLEEWTSHFPGTSSRHWYLSDGGHFENTAAYELVRRRLPFILLCDNGADADRQLDDFSNLVAKSRIDLAAEIRPLDTDGLKDRFGGKVPTGLGSISDLQCSKGDALAALADVDYLDAKGNVEKSGLILIFKPTMPSNVPLDIQAYKRVNGDFPQQTTADQFFDEAQWESYRRLGEFITMEILQGKVDQHPSMWFLTNGNPTAPVVVQPNEDLNLIGPMELG